MHKTLFLAFQIASTARILCLKPCALDLWFLTVNLSFFPTALLRRPPSSVKSRPGVRRRSSRPCRVSSFHFLSLHRLSVTAQILRSSFLAVVLHPARKYGTPFPSGWRIFYIPRPPTLRTSGAASLDVLPPSGQEAWPSSAYTELEKVLAHTTKKLSLDWPDEPCESQSSLTSVYSVALVRARRGESCHSSLTCTTRFPGLGSSPSPLTSLMRRPLTSPTLLVLWNRGTLQSRTPQSRTHAQLRTSRRIPPPHGSPTLFFHPSRVGPPRL